jgi:Tfp pilus assembly protein PilO
VKNHLPLALAALVSLALVAGFWAALWSPQQSAIAETREETERVERQQAEARSTITDLERVRDNADLIELELEAAQSVVPFSPQIPELLDQLQAAADDAGVEMRLLASSRPQPVDIVPPPPVGAGRTLVAYDLQFGVDGGFYEVAEFLRTVENPQQAPRGFVWQSMTLAEDDYPELTATLSARAFAILPSGGVEQPEDDSDDEDGDEEDLDADLDE